MAEIDLQYFSIDLSTLMGQLRPCCHLHAMLLYEQVGRTGMDTCADVEILNLLELPTHAPDLWQLMTQPDHNGVTASKAGTASEATIIADARVTVLSS